jgi:hypothetical protein
LALLAPSASRPGARAQVGARGWLGYRLASSALVDVSTCAADAAALALAVLGGPGGGAGGAAALEGPRVCLMVWRSMRILKVVELGAPVMLKTIQRLSGLFQTMLFLAGSVVYVFAVVGTELYAGERPEAPSAAWSD